MDISILVAKILSITYICAGIGALTGKISYGKLIDDFQKSSALSFIAGYITIILGMIVVTSHNVWQGGWPVLVTVIGWIAVVKGAVLIAFPQYMGSLRGWYQNGRLWGIVMLTIGLVWGYFGFFSQCCR